MQIFVFVENNLYLLLNIYVIFEKKVVNCTPFFDSKQGRKKALKLNN